MPVRVNTDDSPKEPKEDSSVKLIWWRIYPNIFVGEVAAGNKAYRFFAEDMSDDAVTEYEELPLEFFNHELQKVDTTSETSLLKFCQKWGLALSPLYASKTHALSNRDIDGLGYSYYFPVSYRDGIEVVEKRLAEDVVAFTGSYGYNSVGQAVERLIGSEFAREAVARGDYGDPHRFGAVVSVDEVAYTLRQLQLATAMQAAYAGGLKGHELYVYRINDKVIPSLPDEFYENGGNDLFFGNAAIARALIKQREDIKGHSAEDGTEDFGEAAITHVKAFTALDLEVGVENCRSFTKRATLALALENAWAREDGDKPEGDLFWAMPPYISHGSIVEAILATFNFVTDAPFEWRTCEHCGRIFKFQKEYDPKNRYRKSTFCRNSCRVMHAQQLKAAANSGGTGSKVGSINTTNTKSSRWSYSPKRKPKG